MLYFADPTLSARAVLAPPAKLYALENGERAPQKPADRTPNMISRSETIGPEYGLSLLERGFIEELQKDFAANS